MFGLLRQAATSFVSDNCPQMAAALAYYTIFSLPPLLVISISLAGFGARMTAFAPGGAAREVVKEEARKSFGPGAADQLEDAIERASQLPKSPVGVAVGGLLLLFAASGVMVQLQSSLNQIWGVERKSAGGGMSAFIAKRLLSFAMVLGVGFVLLASLIASALLAMLDEQLSRWFPQDLVTQLPWLASSLTNLAIAFLVFVVMYRFLPDAPIQFREVAPAAAGAAALFVLGRTGLTVYFSVMDVGSSYGAAGSLALIMVWVYYSGMIFLLGAEYAHAATSASPDRLPQPTSKG